jgi:protein SCO1
VQVAGWLFALVAEGSMKATALLRIALALCAIFVLGLTFWAIREQRDLGETLPVYGSISSFQLIDQNKTVFDSASLNGHPTVVNFIFTSCAHVCPLLSRQMAKIQDKTKDVEGGVQLISISVDPERDTPAKLLEYGTRYGADFKHWVFLTGPLETIRRVVVKGFMNAIEKNIASAAEPDLFDITHGENFVILDKRGDIRAFRQAKSDRDVYEIVKILRQLQREKMVVRTAAN